MPVGFQFDLDHTCDEWLRSHRNPVELNIYIKLFIYLNAFLNIYIYSEIILGVFINYLFIIYEHLAIMPSDLFSLSSVFSSAKVNQVSYSDE